MVTATWRPCSPRAIAVATAAISRSGFVVPRASSCTHASASAIPRSVATSDGRFAARTPTIVVTAVIQTAATMTIPSLSFSDGSERSGLHCRRPERVADALHGADDVGAELAPHGGDVRVDGAPAGRAVDVAPDLLEQLLAAEDDAGPAREPVHEVELGRREVHELAVAADLAALGIDRDRPGGDRLASPAPAARRARRSSARTRATSSRWLNGLVM